jgi:hypothetical protein
MKGGFHHDLGQNDIELGLWLLMANRSLCGNIQQLDHGRLCRMLL